MIRGLDLATRLVAISEALVTNRTTQIGDAAIRILTEEVRAERMRISEDKSLIGYEATCLIECIAELAYARDEKDVPREQRAVMYINCFRQFVRIDRDIAERSMPPQEYRR
jgi:hypothetical protein